MSEDFNPFPSFSDQSANAGGGVPGSPAYIEAVNASRFVKGFGITALVYALTTICGIAILGGGIGVGVGLFIMRYDSGKYYRYLGIAVILTALAGFLTPLAAFLGPAVLSGAVLWRGVEILRLLSKEGQSDDAWAATRSRALAGTICSGLGLLITLLLLLLGIIGTILLMSGKGLPR